MCPILSFSTLWNKCLQNRGVLYQIFWENIPVSKRKLLLFFVLWYLPTKVHGVTSQKTNTAVKIANIEVPELIHVVHKTISLSLSLCLVFGRASVGRWKDKRQKYLPSRNCTFNVCHMMLKKYTRDEIIFKSVSQKCKHRGIGSLFNPPAHTIRD